MAIQTALSMAACRVVTTWAVRWMTNTSTRSSPMKPARNASQTQAGTAKSA